jgi:hypothetical protein
MLSGTPLSAAPLSALGAAVVLLSADAGTFAFTGNDARFNPTGFPVETGSFTFTGQDVTFPVVRGQMLERGSFVLTGNDAPGARNAVSGSGTFVLTGQAAGLTKGPILGIETGEFVFTGHIVALTADIRVSQLGTKAVNTLISPTNFATGQLDANTIRSNDNIVAQAFTSHDSDATIHVQSGADARRPPTAVEGAVWVSVDTLIPYIYTGGAWQAIGGASRYGAWSDYTDQTLAAANTATLMTFNTVDVEAGASLVSSSRMTAIYAGVYNFQWSGQFVNTDSQIQDIDVWVRINGTDVVGSNGQVSIPNKHGSIDGHALLGWNYYFSLNANDYIQLYWSATSTMVSLETLPAAGPHPSTASLIATMSKV